MSIITEITVGGVSIVVGAVMIWVLGKLGKLIDIKKIKDSIMETESYLMKTFDDFSEDVDNFISGNSFSGFLSIEEITDEIVKEMEENASSIVKASGFKSREKFKKWVEREVRDLIQTRKNEMEENN